MSTIGGLHCKQDTSPGPQGVHIRGAPLCPQGFYIEGLHHTVTCTCSLSPKQKSITHTCKTHTQKKMTIYGFTVNRSVVLFAEADLHKGQRA